MTEDHLSFDELAELAEGLLTEDREGAARAHLAACEQCQARAAAIASTTSLLAGLPPVTMPVDVAARLDAALASAELDSDTPEADTSTADSSPADSSLANPSPADSVTVIPDVSDIRHRRRWSGPTMATSAVAAVLVLLVGAIVIAHLKGNGPSESASSSGATSSLPQAATAPGPVGGNISTDFATLSTGNVYTASNLSTLIPGVISTARHSSARSTAPESGAVVPAATSTASVASGTGIGTGSAGSDQQPSSPASNAPLAQPSSPAYGKGVYGAQTPATLRPISRSRAQLLTCAATASTTPGAVPEAIDLARWTGGAQHHSPSIVLVFNGTKPHTAAVYVMSANCQELRTYALVTLPR